MGICARCNYFPSRRFSYVYGHICDSCFNELILSGSNTDVEKFMNTEKLDDAEAYNKFTNMFPFEENTK